MVQTPAWCGTLIHQVCLYIALVITRHFTYIIPFNSYLYLTIMKTYIYFTDEHIDAYGDRILLLLINDRAGTRSRILSS